MQIPDEVRVLNIMGADYFICWEDLPKGGSFFLPTTATVKQATPAIRAAAAALGIHLEIRQRCEFGRFGVRVWRTY